MSNSETNKVKELARRLLAYEAASGKPANTKAFAAVRVCKKLRGPLGKILGNGVFRSLLSRALALAAAEVSWLRTLQINADGTLEGLDQLEAKLDSRVSAEGEVGLLSQLLGLLITFIGPALTLQLLSDIWPKMDELSFAMEKRHAKS
jgi:hypothetical protein